MITNQSQLKLYRNCKKSQKGKSKKGLFAVMKNRNFFVININKPTVGYTLTFVVLWPFGAGLLCPNLSILIAELFVSEVKLLLEGRKK